jgi:hypothetical protein
MKIIHLNGRLCNNMFQVAACIGSDSDYGILPNTGHWQHQAIYKYFPNVPIKQASPHTPWYSDPSFNYTKIPDGDFQLTGFFQSEKYFAHKREEVLRIFNIDYKPIDYVSLHWRLLDYLDPLNGINPMPLEYYQGALEYFPNRKVLVFSDDIEFCKRHLKGDRFEFSESKNEFEDLSLMASCRHNIIANSTFSWWGAWLNRNPNKIVISPHYTQWFSETNIVKDPVDGGRRRYDFTYKRY